MVVIAIVLGAIAKGFVRGSRTNVRPHASQPNPYDQFDQHSPPGYFECLLDRLPGTVNDVAAQAAAAGCLERFPLQPGPPAAQKTDRAAVLACIESKAKDTRSEQAARGIALACKALH